MYYDIGCDVIKLLLSWGGTEWCWCMESVCVCACEKEVVMVMYFLRNS